MTELSQVQSILLNAAGIGPVAAFWSFVLSEVTRRWKTVMVNIGIGLVAVTLACVMAILLARAIEANRFPLSNLYESILWFVLFITGGYLYVVWEFRQSVPIPANGYIGLIAALLAAAMLLYGSWLPAGQHEIRPLVPALVSYWRQIHVPPLICSYALFFISGAVALLQLYSLGCLRSAIILSVTLVLAGLAISLGTFTDVDTGVLQLIYAGSSVAGVIAAWLQLAHRSVNRVRVDAGMLYDEIGARCINIGLPLLTFGIITGGLWANHAWGTYWSWDPKESMALTTWLAYAAYIHLRVHHELPAEKLSIVAILGVLLTLLTYLGFNSLGFGGLHSYGRFK
jgi:cytochrome c-type biogenesis protein CcsB